MSFSSNLQALTRPIALLEMDVSPILKVLLLASGLTEAVNFAPKIILLAKLFKHLLQTPKKLGEFLKFYLTW